MIVDNLALPFTTELLGVDVTVDSVDLTGRGHVVALCVRGGLGQAISVVDLPLPTPPPGGAQWIDGKRAGPAKRSP